MNGGYEAFRRVPSLASAPGEWTENEQYLGRRAGLWPVSSFGPAGIAIGLHLWLDAQDETTFTLSGSNVTQWRDKSSSALHLNAAATAPVRNATGFNSLPLVELVSSGALNIPNGFLNGLSAFTLAMVHRSPAANEGNFLDNTSSPGNHLVIGASSSFSLPTYMRARNGTNSGEQILSGWWDASINSRSLVAINTSATIATKNGSTAGVSTTGALGGAMASNIPYRLGYASGMRLAEFCVWNRVLDSTERSQLDTYFAERWRIQATTTLSMEALPFTTQHSDITVTNIGSVSQGTGRWSNGAVFSAGNNSRLNLTSNHHFDFGSDDLTMEAWVFLPTSGPVVRTLFARKNYNVNEGFYLYFLNGTMWLTGLFGTYANHLSSSSPVPFDTWTHVALVRSGNTIAMYIGGSRVGTFSYSGAWPDLARPFTIGMDGQDVGIYPMTGTIDDVRISKGIARYSGTTYTVPTGPL
jgi:hypothetical protein